jgi:hypothetical protein
MIELECIQLKNKVQAYFAQLEQYFTELTIPLSELDNWMFMYEDHNVLHFKHYYTRNYLHLLPNRLKYSMYLTGLMLMDKEDRVKYQVYYDRFDVYCQMRTLPLTAKDVYFFKAYGPYLLFIHKQTAHSMLINENPTPFNQ